MGADAQASDQIGVTSPIFGGNAFSSCLREGMTAFAVRRRQLRGTEVALARRAGARVALDHGRWQLDIFATSHQDRRQGRQGDRPVALFDVRSHAVWADPGKIGAEGDVCTATNKLVGEEAPVMGSARSS